MVKKRKIILSEAQKKYILAESQESKSISAAKKLLADRLEYDEQQADEFVRIKLRNDIPVLRTPQGGKFILGATRMFVDGQLRSANDISNLNSTLKLVASDAHINEYDRNLNGLSCSELVERFSKARTANLEAEKEEVNTMVFDKDSQYDIVRIDSFEQAQEYGDYTSWCVTHDKRMFDSYTSNGINQFYFCLRHGFENVEKVIGEGCPLDDYGLSMIAICVNEDGALNTCTCRWNHDNGGNDSIMSTVEISRVVGANFFNTFKPNGKWQEILNTALSRLQSGEVPEDVFDDIWEFSEGFAVVELSRKYNFLTREGKLLSQKWFDGIDYFHEGFAWVELSRKYNFLTREGKYLSQQWFDTVYYFNEGFAMVELNDKGYNFINRNGQLISRQWFNWASDFCEGFAMVELNDKYNFINREGELVSQRWFDMALNFCEGFAKVKLNNKGYNVINREGKYLSQQWFDRASDFCEGFAMVKLNDSAKYIDHNGKLWDKRLTVQEGMNMKKRKTIVLSEAQMRDLILEAMSVGDIYQKYYSDIPEEVYRTVVTQADPTYNPQKPDKMGIYTKWLLGMIRKGAFKLGDVKEAHDLLGVFDRYKSRLEVKDVTQLHSMAELYNLVQPYINSNVTASKSEEIRRVKDEESEVWYEDGEWLVVVPYSEEAAKLYGKGTKWCTAAENDNMYEYYADQGDLYILIRKSDGAKFQFHFETQQFMDAEDKEIPKPIARTIGLTDELVNKFFDYFDDEANYYYPFYLKYNDYFQLENNFICIVLDGKYNILDYYDDVYLLDEWLPIPGDIGRFNVYNLSYDNNILVVLDTSMGIKILELVSRTFFPDGDKYLQTPSAHSLLGSNEWGRYSLDGKWFMMTADRVNGLKRWPEGYYLDAVSKSSYDGWYVVQKGEKYALFCGRGFAKNGTVLPSDNINEWVDAVYDTHDRLLPGNFDEQSVYASFTCFDQADLVKVMKDGVEYYMNGNGKMGRINEEIEESKMSKNKTVILSEEQAKYITKHNSKPFFINPEKVKMVKSYLDKGFQRGNCPQITDDGYPTDVPVVSMLDSANNVIRTMNDMQLFYLLQDRFKGIMGDKTERDRFLQQIIKDWFYNKITDDGLLSVNIINEKTGRN